MLLQLSGRLDQIHRAGIVRRCQNAQHTAVTTGHITVAVGTEQPCPGRWLDGTRLHAGLVDHPPLAVDLPEGSWERRRNGPHQVMDSRAPAAQSIRPSSGRRRPKYCPAWSCCGNLGAVPAIKPGSERARMISAETVTFPKISRASSFSRMGTAS